MRRSIGVAVAVAAIAIPAAALASTVRVTHFGHVVGASGSSVKLKESESGDSRSVKSFAVRNFPLACDGSPASLGVAKLKGKLDVSKSGAFKARNDNGQTVFKVRGQINRNKAYGTFRYSGSVTRTDGTTVSCDSGKLSWVTRP